MNIPKEIKIGGLIYTVEVTENITMGANYTGEIDYKTAAIRIRNMNNKVMQKSLWHELFHGIYDHLGYFEHDEKVIDELAGAIYAIIVDNPEMFKEEQV